jgi:hypothetical protein
MPRPCMLRGPSVSGSLTRVACTMSRNPKTVTYYRHAYINTLTKIHAHTHTHTHTHKHKHKHIYPNTHTHIHTHTHSRRSVPSGGAGAVPLAPSGHQRSASRHQHRACRHHRSAWRHQHCTCGRHQHCTCSMSLLAWRSSYDAHTHEPSLREEVRGTLSIASQQTQILTLLCQVQFHCST